MNEQLSKFKEDIKTDIKNTSQAMTAVCFNYVAFFCRFLLAVLQKICCFHVFR